MEENAQVKVSAIIVAAGASRRMGFDKLSYRLLKAREDNFQILKAYLDN